MIINSIIMKIKIKRLKLALVGSLILISFLSYSQTTKTTYDFSTAATLSYGNGQTTWYEQANITIDGTDYIITTAGNGSLSNSATGGASNSACLKKSGSGGDQFYLSRVDGQPFQFYGIWVKQEGMNYYSTLITIPPWYTLTASTFTYQDMTPVSGSTSPGVYTTSTQTISSGTNGITTTLVRIDFQAIVNFWIDDIIVGPVPGTGPTVTSVSVPANGTYVADQNLNFTINFNQNITVTGTPQLSLTIGSTTKQATYTSGSGTSALIFRYTVKNGDLDTNGITVGTLSANGGTLKNGSGDNAVLTLNSVGSTSNVLVDAVPPSAPSTPDLAASSDSGSSSTDNITNDNTPTFTGTAEANSTVTVLSDGSSIGTTTANGSGNWSFTPGLAISAGTHTITATATDAAGNTSSASLGLSVTIDTSAPSAPSTPDLAASSDSGSSSTDNITNDNTPTFTGTAEANSTVTVLSDGSSIGTTTANGSGIWSLTPGVALSGGTHTITSIATDAAGNTSSASSGLSITIDTSAPSAPSTPDMATGSDSGPSSIDNITNDNTPTFNGTAEANSEVTVLSNGLSIGTTIVDGSGNWSLTPSSAISGGTHTITATATDAAGNTSTASSGLSITIDTSAPSAPSTPDMATGSDSGPSSTDNITNDNTPTFNGTAETNSEVTVLSDNSLIGTTTADGSGNWSFTPGAAISAGTHTITATATDAAGNTSAASSGLSVTIDTSAPSAPSTPDLAASSDSGTSNTDNITNDNTPTFTGTAEFNSTVTILNDGSSLGTITADGSGNWSFTPGSAISGGSHIITAIATDAAGNASVASSGLNVIIDITPPTAVCQNATIRLDQSGNASLIATNIDGGSSDNYMIDSMWTDKYDFSCADMGTNLVTLYLNDMSGNTASCQSTVTVADTTPPAAVCQDKTLFLDEFGQASLTANNIDGGSTDNCSLDSIFIDKTDFSCDDSGLNQVTLTAVDDNGNQGTCMAWVTVRDSIPPVAIGKDTTLYLDSTGRAQIDAIDLYDVLSDNCGIKWYAAVSTFNFNCYALNAPLDNFTLTAMDQSGNTTSSTRRVVIKDTISPIAVCKDISVALDQNGKASITAAQIDGGSSDNCSVDTMWLDRYDFTCADVGDNSVTLLISDASGNTDFCTAMVTVSDTISPIVVCKDISVALDQNGKASITAAQLDGGSTDNCSIDTMWLDKYQFSIADLGARPVTLSVADGSGNVSTCSATVTVGDNIPPKLVTNPITIYLQNDYHLSPSDLAAIIKGSTDNITPPEKLQAVAFPNSFDCSQVNTDVSIKITVLDQAGNKSSGSVIITVKDSVGLQFDVPADIDTTLAAGQCETIVDYPYFYRKTACESFELISGLGKNGMFPVGTSEEKWLLTNTHGDSLVFSFLVNVTGTNLPPTLDPLADVDTTGHVSELMIPLSGISNGGGCIEQTLFVSASGMNPDVIGNITVDYTSPDPAGQLTLWVVPGADGTDTITVTVKDSTGESVSQSFAVSVLYTNEVPEVVAPVPDQEVIADRELKIPLDSLFDDIDADSLFYNVSLEDGGNLPSWVHITNDTLYVLPTIQDTGCFNVVINGTDPAMSTASDTFMVCVKSYPLGIGNSEVSLLNLNMYPNPSNGKVTLEFDHPVTGEIRVLVTDISGRQVLRKTYQSQDWIQLDLSAQVSGTYLVSLEYNNQVFRKKLILKKN